MAFKRAVILHDIIVFFQPHKHLRVQLWQYRRIEALFQTGSRLIHGWLKAHTAHTKGKHIYASCIY